MQSSIGLIALARPAITKFHMFDAPVAGMAISPTRPGKRGRLRNDVAAIAIEEEASKEVVALASIRGVFILPSGS